MDLVDIDQVLNNLELREAANECNNSSNPTSGAGDTAQNVAKVSKGFVGVSQVFNSLDDYQKNVEQLELAASQKYDEECRPIADLNKKHKGKPAEQTKNPEGAQSDITCSTEAVSPKLQVVNAIDSLQLKANQQFHEYEDEEEASNDIHKFSESTRMHTHVNEKYDPEDVTPTATSDSLTTSSSSTFSSGPSPGLASTTDERSSPLSPVYDEEQSALLAPQDQQHEDRAQNEESAVAVEETTTSGAAVEDLAAGLSSISINTVNSQSIMPSSVLLNVLDEFSEPTTTSLISQCREDADNQVQHPTSEAQMIRDGAGASEAHNAPENGAVPVPNKALQVHDGPKVQQPITFGSTMDEISDTELDSMLQEMESEMDVDDTLEFNARKLATVSEMDKSPSQEVSEAAVPDGAVNGTDSLNADSFSQASTVEFSEMKAQSVPNAHTEDLIHSSNSIASSYTSSDSSLDEEAAPVEGEDPESHLRPQRPTTLDLPTLKMNLYANAGQTPPGTAVAQHNGGTDELVEGAERNNIKLAPGDVAIESDNNVAPESNEVAEATGYSDPHANLGKIPPIWVPDNMATSCMQCHVKFTMIKRRHHCRACGKVLCSVCCSQKFKLEFLNDPESRVCVQCYLILTQRQQTAAATAPELNGSGIGGTDDESVPIATPTRSPNPNNPMEYCSTIPPHRQVSNTAPQPPSVIVPVGVLKKDGSYSSNSSNSSDKRTRKRKSVMFSDGIAPGSDLASMEHQWSEAKHARRAHLHNERTRSGGNKPATPVKSESSIDASTLGLVAQLFRGSIPPSAAAAAVSAAQDAHSHSKGYKKNADYSGKGSASGATAKTDNTSLRSRHVPPSGCDEFGCFIPKDDNTLPPLYVCKDDSGRDFIYKDVANNYELLERLQRETLKFALQKNFHVFVKIVNLKCCMNRTVMNFTTCGMHYVGNDEIIILLEFDVPASKEQMNEPPIPKDIFLHLYQIYRDAELGNPIAELSYTSSLHSNFLGSREYGGFIFIRATFQCLQDVVVPENPYLIGILIHRYEVPWAKVFPLRLMLRLGAQYRYYPCPHISVRNRESVYSEIAQTIINFLADFRNYSYTLPSIRGMYIHMEDRQTTVLIPRNRQEDVIKAMNNSSDHILAFGGNFSKTADGHLVCMQNVNDERGEMYAYSTQAINIQGQPRKVTGASFLVLNEALKASSGLSGKCSIVEDGLMVQIMPAKMEEVRNALRNQTNIDIVCGPINADEQQTELVSIKWVENDRDFNLGVKSPIDEKPMEGISSMRVHASFNYSNVNYSIRLTDIYILKFDEWYNAAQMAMPATSLDITRIAEQIARSASLALVPFLDLLAASGSLKIGLRATLHQDNVCYEAGTRGDKLPPLYMNALDDHLIPTLHNESSGIEDAIILELIFYILNV